jgi:hypothetical protein
MAGLGQCLVDERRDKPVGGLVGPGDRRQARLPERARIAVVASKGERGNTPLHGVVQPLKGEGHRGGHPRQRRQAVDACGRAVFQCLQETLPQRSRASEQCGVAGGIQPVDGNLPRYA